MKKVLIIDDERAQLLMLSMIIFEFSSKIAMLCTSDFETAQELIEKNDIDILITDFYLLENKKMNGTVLAKQLKEKNLRANTILFSGYSRDQLSLDQSVWIDFFLDKPINRLEFVSTIKDLLE